METTILLHKRTLTLRQKLNRALPYILISPVLIYYLLFWLRPVIKSLIASFTAYDGGATFQNYLMVFRDPSFLIALRNTTVITIFSVILEFVLALMIALIINRKFKGSGAMLFIALVPMALPPVAAGAIWQTGLTSHGWMNSLLTNLGILKEGAKFYFLTGSEWQNIFLIIIIDAWQVIPSVMIILLAGLQNLPPEAKEAGLVFGGNKFTVLRRITLPMLKPTITTAIILRLISAIQIWLIIVLMFGFNRIPVLLERVIYYKKEVPGIQFAYQMAITYTIVVTLIVSITAIIYLQVSGAFGRKEQG
ncbi:MAG: sugar ABC transporter permease [Bacteroidetes bacterium]|nr:sugar ABC transporter permease [Bacteroidota bacterium]